MKLLRLVLVFTLLLTNPALPQQQNGLERFLGESWMTKPWAPHQVGKHYVRLVDGNHRAFAAIAAGEPSVWVYVLQDYRADVQSLLR